MQPGSFLLGGWGNRQANEAREKGSPKVVAPSVEKKREKSGAVENTGGGQRLRGLGRKPEGKF